MRVTQLIHFTSLPTTLRTLRLAALLAAAVPSAICIAQSAPPTSAVGAMPRMPSQAEIEAAMEEQRRAMPNLPAVPRAPGGRAAPAAAVPDLAELAAQYDAIRRGRSNADEGASGSDRQASGVLVFASLGMPRASMDRLVADAERVSAVIVLRGVQSGSLRQTAERIKELLGARKVAWQIDPTLFKRFGVAVVPAVVLIDPARPVQVSCGSETCAQPAFSKVTGDVTIGHALEAIERQDPEFAALASRFGSRLKGGR